MTYSYEVSVPLAGRALFELAFLRHLEGLGFDHMSVGGWLGEDTSHEFQRGDDLISLFITAEGGGDCHVAVQSETVPVEPLIADVLTEGVADSLETFSQGLEPGPAKQTVQSLIETLRDAFPKGEGG